MITFLGCCYKNNLKAVEVADGTFWSVSVFDAGTIVSFGYGRTREDARKNAMIILKFSRYNV